MDIKKRGSDIKKSSVEAAMPIIKTQGFGKKYESYLVLVFVVSIVIFVFVLIKWVMSDSDAAEVKKNLEAELIKNPVNSKAITENKAAASKSQAQSSQTVQSPPVQAQTDAASKTETENESESADESDTTDEMEKDEGTNKFESAELKINFDYPDSASISEGNKLITVTQDKVSWKIRFYDNKSKKDFSAWYISHFDIETESDCVFTDASIKVGSYDSKLAKPASDDVECEGEGNYAINSDKSRVVRIEIGKETKENVNKILESFKFIE